MAMGNDLGDVANASSASSASEDGTAPPSGSPPASEGAKGEAGKAADVPHGTSDDKTPDNTAKPVVNKRVNSLSDVAGKQDAKDSAVDPNEWWIDANTKGVGEKPKEFNNKTFKTMVDQLKNQAELRKQVSDNKKAPEKYNFVLGEGDKAVEISTDDPIIAAFEGFAKEAAIPQELFSKGLDFLSKLDGERAEKDQDAIDTYYKEEFKKLGDDPKQQIEDLEGWFSTNFPGVDKDISQSLLVSSDAVKLLQKMRAKIDNKKVPADAVTTFRPPPVDKIELRKQIMDPRYKKDRSYRTEVDDAYKRAYPKKPS